MLQAATAMHRLTLITPPPTGGASKKKHRRRLLHVCLTPVDEKFSLLEAGTMEMRSVCLNAENAFSKTTSTLVVI